MQLTSVETDYCTEKLCAWSETLHDARMICHAMHDAENPVVILYRALYSAKCRECVIVRNNVRAGANMARLDADDSESFASEGTQGALNWCLEFLCQLLALPFACLICLTCPCSTCDDGGEEHDAEGGI